MHKDQFKILDGVHPDDSVSVRDYARTFGIAAKSQRTLLYGYDVERETWHIYLDGGHIHRFVYNSREVIDHQHFEHWPFAQALVPNKRLYPERTDYWFANLLKRKHAHLTFTNWKPESDREPEPAYGAFHGLTHHDITDLWH